MIEKLEDKATLSESTPSQLEHELSVVRSELINSKKDLDTQRFAFEHQLEAEARRLQNKIDHLEKHNFNEYNSRLSFCYNCIMFVLKKEYPELNMTKLEAGVNANMDEQNREGEETEVPLSLQKKCLLNPQMKCFINPLKGQLLILLRGPKDLILVLQWKLPKASFEQLFILISLYLFYFFKKKKLNDNGLLTTSDNIDP